MLRPDWLWKFRNVWCDQRWGRSRRRWFWDKIEEKYCRLKKIIKDSDFLLFLASKGCTSLVSVQHAIECRIQRRAWNQLKELQEVNQNDRLWYLKTNWINQNTATIRHSIIQKAASIYHANRKWDKVTKGCADGHGTLKTPNQDDVRKISKA